MTTSQRYLMSSVQQEYPEMEAKHSSLDIINNILLCIIEDIICLLPTKDVVRTSILSKKWRYSWVIVPKLVFDEEDMFGISTVQDHQVKRKSWPRSLSTNS